MTVSVSRLHVRASRRGVCFAPAACLFSLAALLASPIVAHAQSGAVQLNVSGLHITVSAVDRGAFHLVASPIRLPSPPESPFAVERRPWAGAKVQQGVAGAVLQTSEGTLRIAPSGVFTLAAKSGASVIRSGRIVVTDGNIRVTLAHGAEQRLYGAGNEDMNTSGDLTHPSGTQVYKNGATRIPFLWSTGGYGALIANNDAGISWADADNVLTWKVPSSYVDLYLLTAPRGGYGLLDAYSRLTGRAPIPPRWTFGYMQSRWGYTDAADVQDKWRQFRDRKIPVDAFIYDYDWFVNDWEFNPKTFPAGSLALMKQMGLHFVGIRKPRVTGPNLDYATPRGWGLKAPFGVDLQFDLPAASQWWWSKQAPLIDAGVDGWWNDEGEQSYDEAFQMCAIEWEGMRARSSHRAWTISRTYAPGMQRFGAAVWSGDIQSRWSTLANQPGTLMNFSMAGMPYVSQDIGGFFGPPTPEMYARWMEEGALTPVMRAHGMLNEPRWPWAFGEEAQAALTHAIELRYRLIPYIYTYAAENSRTGAPLMRPLFLDFPRDENTFNCKDEWMFGANLLAAPILSEGGSRDVYLPAGQWYDFNTNEAVQGGRTLSIIKASLSTIPIYLRAGAILPLGPVLQYTGEKPIDPLEVRVYPGADGAFSLYEDGGDDYDYQKGKSSEIPMAWNEQRRVFTIGKRIGSYPQMLPTRHIVVKLPDGRTHSVVYHGQPVVVPF